MSSQGACDEAISTNNKDITSSTESTKLFIDHLLQFLKNKGYEHPPLFFIPIIIFLQSQFALVRVSQYIMMFDIAREGEKKLICRLF